MLIHWILSISILSTVKAGVVERQLTTSTMASTTTANCSIPPTACYLSTPYPVALHPGLNCTYNFQCLSNNCSSTQRCGISPFGGNCLSLNDCETQNCTNTICTFRIIPLRGGCLRDQECIGYPTNICDPFTSTCRVKTGNLCNDASECQSGVVCESVLCAEGELCPDQKFCVNVTATATASAVAKFM